MKPRKEYRRHAYKKRGAKIQGFKFLQNHKFVQIWYWGVHDEFGKTYCEVRTETNPNWCIKGANRPKGYKGFDWDRQRWVIRPKHDGPTKKRLKFGWRYKVYG